jgi:uncharacterized membrane protein YqaE (UPF0057 family)
MFRPLLIPVSAFLLLWAVVFTHYQTNFAGIAPDRLFHNWQLNGQARVLGGIVADVHGLDKQGSNMGRVYHEGTGPDDLEPGQKWTPTYEIFAEYPEGSDVVFDAYPTQYGLQQIAYSWVTRHFGLTSLGQIQTVVAALSAAALAWLVLLYCRVYDPLLAAFFLLALGATPMFITMGRNLYWSPFLLLLPAILSVYLYWARGLALRIALLIAIAGAMFLKSASNYEYITSVTMLACATFLVAPFFEGARRPRLLMALAVWGACVAGFIAALLLHADMRGDTLVEGLQNIYIEDVARRTYGDSSSYQGETKQSLDASTLDVLKMYLYEFYPGKRLMVLPGKVFLALIGLSLIGLLHKAVRQHPHFRRDLAILVVFFSIPASWFVLAKGHSFTQTHINFVLWYFGFIPALLYVSWSTVKSMFSDIALSISKGRR